MVYLFLNLVLANLLFLFLIRERGDFFIYQLTHLFIFSNFTYLIFVLWGYYLYFRFKRKSSYPFLEKIWILPLFLIVGYFFLLWMIFFLPSYFKDSFWSTFLEVPTPFFARLLFYFPYLLLFNFLYFVFSILIAFFKRNFFKEEKTKRSWKKKRYFSFAILIVIIIGALSFLLFNPTYILYFKLKTGEFNPSLWSDYFSLKNNWRIKDYLFYRLIKNDTTNFQLTSEKKDEIWKKYLKYKVSDVYSDDLYFLLLKNSQKLTLDEIEKFLKAFPQSPWREELIYFFLKKDKPSSEEKSFLKDKLFSLSTTWSNLILKIKGKYLGYYLKDYPLFSSTK